MSFRSVRERLFGGLNRHSARSIEASAGGGRVEGCPQTGARLGISGAGPHTPSRDALSKTAQRNSLLPKMGFHGRCGPPE